MKLFVVISIAFLFVMLCLSGSVSAKDYEVTKKAGNLSVLIKIDKNPPIVGKNNVEIAVTDSTGKAVSDAKVVVELSMAPMPGMPAANYKYNAELRGDRYKTIIEPSMAGPWSLAAKITRGGKTDTAKLSLDVK